MQIKKERQDREKEKKEESAAAGIAARKSAAIPEIHSTEVEKETGKLTLDPNKKEEFYSKINDEISSDKNIQTRISNIENASKDILTDEQKTDEGMKKLWNETYADTINESNAKNTFGQMYENSKVPDSVKDAKEELRKFRGENNRINRFTSSKSELDAYNSRVKELEDNIKKEQEKYKNSPESSKYSIPDFNDFKKEKLTKSAAAESKIESESNAIGSVYGDRFDKILKNDGYGVKEKVKDYTPLSVDEVRKKTFNETANEMRKSGITDENTISVYSAKVANDAGEKQAKVIKEARENASAKAIKTNEKEEKISENSIKDNISIIKEASKSLDSYAKSKDKQDMFVNGIYLSPKEYMKYETDRIESLKSDFRKKYPGYDISF